LPFDEISLPEMTNEFLFKDVSISCAAGLDVRVSRAAKHSFFNSVVLSVPLGNSLSDFIYDSFDDNTREAQLASSAIKVCLKFI
jgi:hypothetical protein